MNKFFCAAAGAVGLWAGAASWGTPIAHDSVAVGDAWLEYAPGSIRDQNPLVGCRGFAGPWNGGTSAFVAASGGLTHPLTPGETKDGRLIASTSSSSATRNLGRPLIGSLGSGSYFMSVLLQKNAFTSSRDLLAGLSAYNPPETSIFDIYGTYIGFVDGGISFFAPGAQLWQLLPNGQVSVNETYFALLQYDYNAKGPDAVTATIYGGDSAQVAQQTFAGLSLDGSLTHFSVLTQEFGPMVAIDEWRLGSTLADVMRPPAMPGDYDGDQDVDGTDLLIWQRGESPSPLSAEDYATWQSHFGARAAAIAAQSVPEPNLWPWVAAVALACSRRRCGRG